MGRAAAWVISCSCARLSLSSCRQPKRMRFLFYMAFTAFVMNLVSCNQSRSAEQTPASKLMAASKVPVTAENIKGTYSGDFKGSPIAITFRYVSGNRISGYNIHNGLKRNMSGSISLEGRSWHIQVNEPGTNPSDGSFDLQVDTSTWTGKGRWMPFKKGEATSFNFTKHQIASGSIYSVFVDSLQNSIELKEDGSCVYNVLQNDSLSTAQQVTVRGNFKILQDSTVLVYWQKNDLFASQKSTFKLYRVAFEGEENDEYRVYGLKGEGKEFTQLFD
jgi:hypothetical protein